MPNTEFERAESRIPHNFEAERAVIGCLIQDNSLVEEVFATISAEMFYDKRNRALFASIGELRAEGVDIDKVTLKDQTAPKAKGEKEKKNSIYDRVNSIRYKVKEEGFDITKLDDEFFADLLRAVPVTAGVLNYCNIIKEKYIMRKAIELAGNIIEDCATGEKNSQTICNDAQDGFFKLSSNSGDKSYVKASDLVLPIFEEIAEAGKSVDGITGVRTNFNEFDTYTAGLQKTDMIVLAGRPGMGKTTFALNLAYNICLNNNSVLFFSLEMNNTQLVKRVISSLSKVPSNNMRTGKIGENAWQDLMEGARKLHNKNFFIEDSTYLTIAELKNECQKVKTAEGLDVVFIDYLQLMHAGSNYRNSGNSKNGFMNRQEEVAEISRNIKALAKDLNVPIIALSQLAREAETKKKPQLSDLRESGAIEQDADIVLLLNRPDEEQQDNIELIIAKHRNGSTGSINFKFDKSTTSFIEWDNNTQVPTNAN